MLNIQKTLLTMEDPANADFQAKLTPGADRSTMLGIKIPRLRGIAKEYKKDAECTEFIKVLPHKYYDEMLLHAILVSEIKDQDECILELKRLLPYVGDWAVCDTLIPKSFKHNKAAAYKMALECLESDATYTIRFGIGTLMRFFLDEDFEPEHLELVANIISDEYYVNMMSAWYYATALAKQWDSTIKYFEEQRLSDFVHAKSIQKAIESFRVSDEHKEYLRTLKRK